MHGVHLLFVLASGETGSCFDQKLSCGPCSWSCNGFVGLSLNRSVGLLFVQIFMMRT